MTSNKFRKLDATCYNEASISTLIRLNAIITDATETLLDDITHCKKRIHVSLRIANDSNLNKLKEGSIQTGDVHEEGGSIPQRSAKKLRLLLLLPTSELLKHCHFIFSESFQKHGNASQHKYLFSRRR